MRILSRTTIPHGIFHTTNMIFKKIGVKKIVHCLCNYNTHITNWANIDPQVEKLATTNDANIWMIQKIYANVRFPPKKSLIVFGLNYTTLV
jgi:hypothetical protein